MICNLLKQENTLLLVGFDAVRTTDGLLFLDSASQGSQNSYETVIANDETRSAWCRFTDTEISTSEEGDRNAPVSLLWNFEETDECGKRIPFQENKKAETEKEQLELVSSYKNKYFDKIVATCRMGTLPPTQSDPPRYYPINPATNRIQYQSYKTFIQNYNYISGFSGYFTGATPKTREIRFISNECRRVLLTDAWMNLLTDPNQASQNSVVQPLFVYMHRISKKSIYDQIAGFFNIDDMDHIQQRFQTFNDARSIQKMQFIWRFRTNTKPVRTTEYSRSRLNSNTGLNVQDNSLSLSTKEYVRLTMQYEIKLASMDIAPPVFIILDDNKNDNRRIMALTVRSFPVSQTFRSKSCEITRTGETMTILQNLQNSISKCLNQNSNSACSKGIPDVLMCEFFDLLQRMGDFSDIDFSASDIGLNIQKTQTGCKQKRDMKWFEWLKELDQTFIGSPTNVPIKSKAIFTNILMIFSQIFAPKGQSTQDQGIGNSISKASSMFMLLSLFQFKASDYSDTSGENENEETQVIGFISRSLESYKRPYLTNYINTISALLKKKEDTNKIDLYSELKNILRELNNQQYITNYDTKIEWLEKRQERCEQAIMMSRPNYLKNHFDCYAFGILVLIVSISHYPNILMKELDKISTSEGMQNEINIIREKIPLVSFDIHESEKQTEVYQKIKDSRVRFYKLDVDCTKDLRTPCSKFEEYPNFIHTIFEHRTSALN